MQMLLRVWRKLAAKASDKLCSCRQIKSTTKCVPVRFVRLCEILDFTLQTFWKPKTNRKHTRQKNTEFAFAGLTSPKIFYMNLYFWPIFSWLKCIVSWSISLNVGTNISGFHFGNRLSGFFAHRLMCVHTCSNNNIHTGCLAAFFSSHKTFCFSSDPFVARC